MIKAFQLQMLKGFCGLNWPEAEVTDIRDLGTEAAEQRLPKFLFDAFMRKGIILDCD